jgi:hypothetical protein
MLDIGRLGLALGKMKSPVRLLVRFQRYPSPRAFGALKGFLAAWKLLTKIQWAGPVCPVVLEGWRRGVPLSRSIFL